MEQVISTEKLPIKLWLNDIEEGALDQAKDLANLPFAFKHIAIMPDSHQGYGMPIGGVLATKDVIVPNAVGVDIGCGMVSVATDISEIETSDLKKIMALIRQRVPVGFKKHKEKQDEKWMPELSTDSPVSEQEYEKALYQIGTLGGGNHFIEIQKSVNDGYIWIMIHSGSRNIGYTVAKHYHEKAVELHDRFYQSIPKDLSYFPLGTDEYWWYFNEMNYCIEFALQNRLLMMERVKSAFRDILGDGINFSDYRNKPHNFAELENHFGENVIVHRKGATRARLNEIGMIPGSQGSSSYIVRGLGEPQSFQSCSHGAGRVMSRTKARKTLSVEFEKERLEKMGVLHAIRNKNDLDEAPSSYKNIETVMENQKDLAEVLFELKPLAVIKG